jgi:hypothetical protein
MAQTKPKKQEPAPLVVEINPQPLNGQAYIIRTELTNEDVTRFRLAWERINREAGIQSWALVLPKNVEVEELSTPELQIIEKKINRELKSRGVYDM